MAIKSAEYYELKRKMKAHYIMKVRSLIVEQGFFGTEVTDDFISEQYDKFATPTEAAFNWLTRKTGE